MTFSNRDSLSALSPTGSGNQNLKQGDKESNDILGGGGSPGSSLVSDDGNPKPTQGKSE